MSASKADRHPHVLIIDASQPDGGRLRRDLESAGWCASFIQPTQALPDLPVPFVPEVIVVEPAAARDGRGPVGCPRALHQLRDRFPGAGMVVVTDSPSLADCFHAARLGARAYLAKPVTAEMIVASVEGVPFASQPESPKAAIHSLARYEWEYVAWVMAISENNKSKAARMLGIRRGSLQRKLAKRPPGL